MVIVPEVWPVSIMLVEAAAPPEEETATVLVWKASVPMPSVVAPPRFSASNTRVPFGLIKCNTRSETRGWTMRTPASTETMGRLAGTWMVEMETASSGMGVGPEARNLRGSGSSPRPRVYVACTLSTPRPWLQRRRMYKPGLIAGLLKLSIVMLLVPGPETTIVGQAAGLRFVGQSAIRSEPVPERTAADTVRLVAWGGTYRKSSLQAPGRIVLVTPASRSGCRSRKMPRLSLVPTWPGTVSSMVRRHWPAPSRPAKLRRLPGLSVGCQLGTSCWLLSS